MEKLGPLKKAGIILVVCAAAATAASAQTFTILHSFCAQTGCPDGANPYASLIQATDGDFYGTTYSGGAYRGPYGGGGGTVFKITAGGTLTVLYSFCAQTGCPDGANPYASLIQATDGNFYGTTEGGGSNNCQFFAQGCGTVFKITPDGALTTLHRFCDEAGCPDGANPKASLIEANDGNLYGTTLWGGAYGGIYTSGTVFKISPAGALTTLHSFDGTDGSYLWAGLMQAADGNFYGTASTNGGYGPSGYGTVFRITPEDTLTTLHHFNGSDGGSPTAGLMQAGDGSLYGTTLSGGAYYFGGTVFKISPAGALTTLHSFCTYCPEGKFPYAGLTQGTDGNFYGTTWEGGLRNRGTVFEISPEGTLLTLHRFESTDGAAPGARLIQAIDGSFYGTTFVGGSSGDGTVFRLTVTPAVTLSSTSLNFGNQALDQSSAAKTVTLKNSGTALLNIRGVAIEGSSFRISANTCSGAVLSIRKTCTLSVAFTPTVLGKLTGTLTLTDNASNSPQIVALSGTGVGATSTTLTSSLNPAIYGQKVVFTSVVNTTGPVPPTGKVVFTEKYFTEVITIGAATLSSSGLASLVKSNLNAGLYPITATYKGDVNDLASTSAVVNQIVQQTTSSGSLTSSPNPSTVGQTVTFTAKITSPTVTPSGPVTLTLGQTTLGTAQLSGGKATFTTSSLPSGSNVVKVTYEGNSNIARSSAAVTQVVQP